jgi:hypothetical protein
MSQNDGGLTLGSGQLRANCMELERNLRRSEYNFAGRSLRPLGTATAVYEVA